MANQLQNKGLWCSVLWLTAAAVKSLDTSLGPSALLSPTARAWLLLPLAPTKKGASTFVRSTGRHEVATSFCRSSVKRNRMAQRSPGSPGPKRVFRTVVLELTRGLNLSLQARRPCQWAQADDNAWHSYRMFLQGTVR